VLMRAREHGCEWDADTVAHSPLRASTLRVLQLARGHHCPWDEDTVRNAAEGGHLEVLMWA
jgi:hypothetical protein